MSHNFNFLDSGYIPSAPYNFNFGISANILYKLFGTSQNFVAIWADSTASRTNAKMYVASEDTFSVIDLSSKTLYDFYSQEAAGRANETLTSDDITDINA